MWETKLEEPVKTNYRGIDVYKLTTWTQGPVLLAEPGRLELTDQVPPFIRAQLEAMGYDVEVVERTYNPSMGIYFDAEQGVMHGGASDYGDDYGIAW